MAAWALCASRAHGAAWPVEREWTEEEEQAYSQWFEKLASKAWSSTNQMHHNKEYNSLYDAEDARMHYYSDCGDLPYIIRAYYAFKRRLPFVGNFISGGRYTAKGNTTSEVFDSLSHDGSAQSFFEKLTGIHSGNFRTAPEAADSFTYPIVINRQTLRPGMVFYSPNGHVALVAECREDGTIKLADAHPDQSVTHITFGPKLEVRSRTFSGGFRGFRKVIVKDGRAAWVRDNNALPGYSREQYEFKDYYGSIREQLAKITIDPLVAFETYIREDTYQEALDRLQSVELAWPVGREHEIPIPPNIYDASGDWENYSSPSRDLRLRLSCLNIPEQVRYFMRQLREHPENLVTSYKKPEELGQAQLDLKEKLFKELSVQYTNSRGQKVTLTLNDLEERLFRLSFDPNHAPELRWGATGEELKTALTSQKRYSANYETEQYWRNRLEKKQGEMSSKDSDNPRQIPRHDISQMIREVIAEESGKAAPAIAQGPSAGAQASPRGKNK